MAPGPVILADPHDIMYFRLALVARKTELMGDLYKNVRIEKSWKDEMAFIEDMLIISQP